MKKITFCMWVPNSERGHEMPSLEGENEIPHIPKLDFLAKMRVLPYGLNLSENEGFRTHWNPWKLGLISTYRDPLYTKVTEI